LGEETNTYLTTTSFQVVLESVKVLPQPPLLQTKQPQFPKQDPTRSGLGHCSLRKVEKVYRKVRGSISSVETTVCEGKNGLDLDILMKRRLEGNRHFPVYTRLPPQSIKETTLRVFMLQDVQE